MMQRHWRHVDNQQQSRTRKKSPNNKTQTLTNLRFSYKFKLKANTNIRHKMVWAGSKGGTHRTPTMKTSILFILRFKANKRSFQTQSAPTEEERGKQNSRDSDWLDPWNVECGVDVDGRGQLQPYRHRIDHPLHFKRTHELWHQFPWLCLQRKVLGQQPLLLLTKLEPNKWHKMNKIQS